MKILECSSKGDKRFSAFYAKISFYDKIRNKSHLVFIIETTEGKKFGCYISNTITEEGKYINDPNAFIFTFKDLRCVHIIILLLSNPLD